MIYAKGDLVRVARPTLRCDDRYIDETARVRSQSRGLVFVDMLGCLYEGAAHALWFDYELEPVADVHTVAA
jgi:hypothetical protein